MYLIFTYVIVNTFVSGYSPQLRAPCCLKAAEIHATNTESKNNI